MNPFQKAQAARNAAKERKAKGRAANINLRSYEKYKESAETVGWKRVKRKPPPPPTPKPPPRRQYTTPPPKTPRRNNTPPPKTPLQPNNPNYQSALKYFGYPNLTATTAAKNLRKRYLQKAIELHPNKGGTNANFQTLGKYYGVLSKRVF